MNNQSLRYAFPFSQFSFNTDIGFILLVEGRQSPFFTVGCLSFAFARLAISPPLVMQTDISLPFKPQTIDTTQLYKNESEIEMPDQQQLDAFRDLLSRARRKEKLKVPKQVAEARHTIQKSCPRTHSAIISSSNMILWRNANETSRLHNTIWRWKLRSLGAVYFH